jgi:uncharacterized protein
LRTLAASFKGEAHAVVEYLAKGADVNIQCGGTKITALIAASARGHKDVVETLLSARADVQITDLSGNTALHHTIPRERRMMEMLIDSGADLEARNDYGCTPLCHAAMYGKVYLLHDLLTFGSNVNAVDYEGHSALHLLILYVFRTQHTYGIDNRFLEAIEFLLDREANPLLVDLGRRTARGILMAEAQEKFASRVFPTGE